MHARRSQGLAGIGPNARSRVWVIRWLAATLVCVLVAVLAAASSQASALVRAPQRLQVQLDDGRTFELEALVVKPEATGRYPLALITHGSPRSAPARARMSATQMLFQAEELAARGYVAAVVMRRGYGSSSGGWDETYGRCSDPDYERAARESARDLRAAIQVLALRKDVDASRIVAIGQSAGGIGTVALAAQPPEGLKAIVNFAGGRGSRGPSDVCREDRLVAAYAEFGKTARIPSLWIYTENDLFFRPELARRMFDAFKAQGGVGELRILPAFGEDGHGLFYRRAGLPHWRPLLDAFLRQHALPARNAAPDVSTESGSHPPFSPREKGRG